MPFLILFIIIPVVEMWVLIQVGSQIGALPTIALVLLTAMVGLALLRQQGLATMIKANQRAAAGQIPLKEMVEGIFLAVGGALLLTPGFITDALGLCCLIPGLRHLLIGRLLKPIIAKAASGKFYQYQSYQKGASQDDIIEGEFKRQSDRNDHSDRDRLQ